VSRAYLGSPHLVKFDVAGAIVIILGATAMANVVGLV
jgi:hypothetical protein